MDKWIKEDHEFMDRALSIAKKGLGRTNPNPMVGAVIVKDEKIIGEGYHGYFGGPHAEVIALQKAGENATEATMYVTLEPCCHYGKTPPCVDQIVKAGIKRVVIASLDPNDEVAGKGMKYLQAAGIKTEVGLRADEANQQNEVFRKFISSGTPFVVSKWGMSLDGKIATKMGESQWITSEKARLDSHKLRAHLAAILVGVGTLQEDNPLLSCRHPHYNSHNPLRIVVDSHFNLTLDTRVLETAEEIPTVIAGLDRYESCERKQEKTAAIESKGAKCWFLPPDQNGRVSLQRLIKKLGDEHIDSVLVEGGATLHGSALETGIIDKFIAYIGDVVIGGDKAPSPVGGEGFAHINESMRLDKLSQENFDATIKITAYPTGG